MKTYLEVVAFDGNKVVKRIDVTDKSEHQIERVEDGMNINLNHEAYFTRVKEYDTEQPLQP
jgi:hypothetical protein